MTDIDIADRDSVTAQVGDTLVIGLDETPSTGFTWSIDITGNAVTAARDTATGNARLCPGAPGRRTFVFNAAESGKAQVTLTLARPWAARPPAQVRNIDVTVQG